MLAGGLSIGSKALAEAPTVGPLLAPPNQSIDRLIPNSVLDSFDEPIRVAARPPLDWKPGLEKDAKSVPPAAPTEKPAEAPAEPGEAPALIAPERAAEPEAAPPETELLPLLAPRAKAAAEPKPTPEPQPTATKPAQTPAPAAEPQEEEPQAAAPEKPTFREPAPLAAPEKPRSITAKSEPPARTAKPEPKKKADDKRRAEAKTAPPEKPAKEQPAEREQAAPKKDQATPKKRAAPKRAPTASAEPPAPLPRGLRNLRSRMRTVLSFYYRKPLNTVEHDPWEIMHSMLSYELHSRIHNGGPNAPYMTAIGHLCFNRPSKRQRLMTLTEDGRLQAQVGVGVQGHKGQFLAMLAQCNVSPEYPIRVGGKEFTIRDLIDSEQRTCEAKTELTFKLMGLGHYLDSDAEWLDERGERWDIPRLIYEERNQPIRGVACGGTHRLAGLSLAFRRREARGEPVDGEYAEAAKFVAQYQGYAFRLQNNDGSLSTEWFRGPGDEDDIDRRLRTTGHLLEWLVYSLPDDQLRSHRTVRAVSYLTNLLASNADHEWHLGSIAHGLHALVLYDKRVFRPHDKQAEGQLAAVDPTSRLFREYPIYRGVMRNSPPQHGGFLNGLFGNPRTSSSSSRRR